MKETIKYLLGEHMLPEEGLEWLRSNTTLTPYQKNLIWTIIWPVNIGDYELPNLIKGERGDHQEGWLEPKEKEILLLVRAWSCTQYRKYMQHLLYSFTQHPDCIMIPSHREDGEVLVCGVCGKPLLSYNEWEEKCKASPAYGEQRRREYLAFGSSLSSQCMCLNCQIQMNELQSIIEENDL